MRREALSPLNIFLDDGGVITDKQQRAAEFERLVGGCFVPLFGGTEEAWTRAHRAVVDQLADPQSAGALAATDFVDFYQAYQLRWVAGMCELLDLPIPSEEECLALAYQALDWITHRIQTALPGAVETIRLLHRQGYALHTASGSCSLELAGYFEGLGVRRCFGRLYGANLINIFKESTEYYTRIFADLGIRPAEALVVDDSPDATRWAAQLGARTVLVNASLHPETDTTPRLESLVELPTFLQQRW
jgi:HAD superfamily hydrolase (TIGR01509 family)